MDAVDLLRKIISIPAFSGHEGARADFVAGYLAERGLEVGRIADNLIVRVGCGANNPPVVMLNSHLDTVRPSQGYTFDPFRPPPDCRRIYGLGSNDAGGAVVSMIAAALHFRKHGGLDFDLLLLLSAEEETSGQNGISLAMKHAGKVDCAIIGEPTQMKAAIAECGLLVLDGTAHGIGGHAARGEGENAIYKALRDIETLRNYRFASDGNVRKPRLTVTQISAGTQHNVVPDKCTFVADIRTAGGQTHEEIWQELQAAVGSTLTPRSLTGRSSATPPGHPLVRCAEESGIETFISPTTSDWMRLGDVPVIKMGPGDSARSHTADEYIAVGELEEGIAGYIGFLENLKITISYDNTLE